MQRDHWDILGIVHFCFFCVVTARCVESFSALIRSPSTCLGDSTRSRCIRRESLTVENRLRHRSAKTRHAARKRHEIRKEDNTNFLPWYLFNVLVESSQDYCMQTSSNGIGSPSQSRNMRSIDEVKNHCRHERRVDGPLSTSRLQCTIPPTLI